jgi:hypothetical protein
MRVLTGQAQDSSLVNDLYENYGIDEVEGHGNITDKEGPFLMPNGRTVYYSLTEKKFYDPVVKQPLNESEARDLYSSDRYDAGVILHAYKDGEETPIRLESAEAIPQMADTMLANGFSQFSVSMDDVIRAPYAPDRETVEEACWKGYTQKGYKKKGGKRVPNCVKEGKLTAGEANKLDKLKKEYEDGSMYKNMIQQYGEEEGKQVFYATLTNMAKEAVEDVAVLESKNHPDGDMAMRQVQTMQKNVKRLMSMLSDSADYPAWWQSKLTKAEDYLDVVTDYLASEPVTEGAVVPTEVAKKYKDIIPNGALKNLGMAEIEEFYRTMADGNITDEAGVRELVSKLEQQQKGAMKGAEAVSRGRMSESAQLDEAAKYAKKASKSGKEVGSDTPDSKRDRKKAEKDEADKKAPNESPFVKGDKVKHGSKEKVVVVPNGPANLVGVADSMDGKVSMVKIGSLTRLDEAVDATVFGNTGFYHAVDDAEQKGERTGKDYLGTSVKTPREVIEAIDKRIKEVQESIDRYDRKGYNEKSIKVNVIEALEQIKKNLQQGDLEGIKEAQIYFGTLMSPIWDFFPAQLVNYIAKGPSSE